MVQQLRSNSLGSPDHESRREVPVALLAPIGCEPRCRRPNGASNEYVHEWPGALDRTRTLVDGALGKPEAAVTPAMSRA
ncbi:hypothetical protein DMB66_28280 [Actinoplanes sp. ATCC 53533]|nr:hypothetical protein DMB66_28280 [Actinoplanes sp. ATCC 53533]